MPAKPKNNQKEGQNGKNGTNTLLGPIFIEATHVLTALQMMHSPEDVIVLKAIVKMDSYVSMQNDFTLNWLLENGLLKCLLELLSRPLPIVRYVLKIINRLKKLDGIISFLRTQLSSITDFVNLLVGTEDDVVKEYTTHMLSCLCRTDTCAKLLCRSDLVICLFDIIVNTLDPDVQCNCLEVLFCMTECSQAPAFISEAPVFKVPILNCLLKSPYSRIRDNTLDIMRSIAKWEVSSIHYKLHEAKTVQYLVTVLQSEAWTEMQNKALGVILACVQHSYCQVNSIESREFLSFVSTTKTATPSHGLAAASIIAEFAKDVDARQALFDLKIEEEIIEYFKHGCELMRVRLCEALSGMAQNWHCCKKMASEKLLLELSKTMGLEDFPWIPYRQAPIPLMYQLINVHHKVALMMYKTNCLRPMRRALECREHLDKSAFMKIVDMFKLMFNNQALQKYLLTKPTYNIMLDMIEDPCDDIMRKALSIIYDSLRTEDCRDWFVEFNGVSKIMPLILNQADRLSIELISFVQQASKFRNVGMTFIRAGIIPILETMDMFRKKPLVSDQIINAFYSFELSLKFHDKDCIGIDEVTRNGFQVYLGYKPEKFPVEEETDETKLCSACTVLVANLAGRKRTRIPLKSSLSKIVLKKPAPVHNSLNTSSSILNQTIFRMKVPSGEGDTGKCDYFLRKYVRKAADLLKEKHNMTEKIFTLAQFVDYQLCGTQDYQIPLEHDYECHLSELKLKFKSNYIPLGHVRMGRMVERSMLFKVLGDRVGVPTSLCRSGRGRCWNEVPVLFSDDDASIAQLKLHVIDLMYNVGNLMQKGKWITLAYCQGVDIRRYTTDSDETSSKSDSHWTISDIENIEETFTEEESSFLEDN